MRATVREAVELADRANARLTLVKVCEPGRAYVWAAPFAVGAAYLPPDLESPEEAAQVLSRLADEVPASIPVTTIVLTDAPQVSLPRLLRQGHFGAIVADEDVLSRCRRLRRQLRREPISVVTVTLHSPERRSGGRIAAHFSSNGDTEDGVLDGGQITEGHGRRRSVGLRPWSGRRLAGAGGKH